MEIPKMELEEADFEIVKESWNRYNLADGSKLKARAILTKLLRPKGSKGPLKPGEELLAAYQNIVVASSPEELMGPPNIGILAPQALIDLKKHDVEILESKEDWNIYSIEDKGGRVKTKLVVTSVQRIEERYTEDGTPVYLIGSSIVLGP